MNKLCVETTVSPSDHLYVKCVLSKELLTQLAEKHKVDADDLVIGIRGVDLIVQSFSDSLGRYPLDTLEFITIKQKTL